MDPHGTVVFATVGRPQYGFDIFSVQLAAFLEDINSAKPSDRRLTDGVSVNFNGQFLDEGTKLVFVSERSGSSQIYLHGNSSRSGELEQLFSPSGSLFHDRPLIRKDGSLLYISAHESPPELFKSWSALYSTDLRRRKITRLTPAGAADFSPSVSQSGKFVAVASYGSRPWEGEFHDLQTDIVVFSDSNPAERIILCPHGGWPQWSGDSTVYFHRQADDGWWSIYKMDLPEDFKPSDYLNQNAYPAAPVRVTPPGLHCFTPAAMHNSSRIATATRRRGSKYRHIEIFDIESSKFIQVTELLNPNCNHYSPFISPDSTVLGYHRFRGESPDIIPHLDPVTSPIKDLQVLRLNGSFPSFSPSGDFIVSSGDLEPGSGLLPALSVVRSDGSKRWTLLKDRMAFGNSWSPTEPGVIFTSIGPIFESVNASVQIARVTFDPQDLSDDSVDTISIGVKILTKEATGNNAFPSCSPDGRLVVFRSGRSGHKNLFVIDSVNGEFGGEIRQLTDGAWIDTMPSWSPDGNLIAFSSNRQNPDDATRFGIYVIRPDGTGLRRVHVAGPLEGYSSEHDRERLNHVCFSSDGEWLLFTANLGGLTAEPVSLPHHFQPYGDLYMVRIDGTAVQRLTINGYENGTPAWHPKATTATMVDSESKRVGEKLVGHFDDPTWIDFDL